jgi:hypothetical protein
MKAFWQTACGAVALLVSLEEARAAAPSVTPAVAQAASSPA